MITNENVMAVLNEISKQASEKVFSDAEDFIILDYDEYDDGYIYFRAVKNTRSFQIYADKNGALLMTRHAFKQLIETSGTTNENLAIWRQ